MEAHEVQKVQEVLKEFETLARSTIKKELLIIDFYIDFIYQEMKEKLGL